MSVLSAPTPAEVAGIKPQTSIAPHRDIGPFALMLTGLGSIIGSGWLFGAWRTAGLAGPGAVFSWVVGAAIITMIALTYAELGAMFPESGGMVRYGHYSHGMLVGFIAGWANWIAIVSVIPVEAEASVQYTSSWPWEWAHGLYIQSPGGPGELSASGLAFAALLVLIYFLLNFWTVKLFAHTNSLITLFKLVVPALTAVALIASGFHSGNFSVPVEGAGIIDLPAILTAVATAGIVFSYNGFQSPVNMAGEARDPDRSIPFAVLGSIAIATVIYVLLQVAYIGAVPTDLLAKAGWHGIDFASPFAELAIIVNLQWLAILLYADAFVSPSGTALTYTASSARMIYGMERNGTLPKILGRLHPRWGVPRPALWFDLAVSYLFLFWLRSWSSLAAVISVATIISYLTGPVSAIALRRFAPALNRPLRIRGLEVLAPVAFVLGTELFYWARWPLTGKIILLMLVALPVYAYYQRRRGWTDLRRNLRAAAWLLAYLPAMALLSWAGSTTFGGQGYLSYGPDLAVVAVVALGFYFWGVRSAWRTPALEERVAGGRAFYLKPIKCGRDRKVFHRHFCSGGSVGPSRGLRLFCKRSGVFSAVCARLGER
jgi:amino acid transporter